MRVATSTATQTSAGFATLFGYTLAPTMAVYSETIIRLMISGDAIITIHDYDYHLLSPLSAPHRSFPFLVFLHSRQASLPSNMCTTRGRSMMESSTSEFSRRRRDDLGSKPRVWHAEPHDRKESLPETGNPDLPTNHFPRRRMIFTSRLFRWSQTAPSWHGESLFGFFSPRFLKRDLRCEGKFVSVWG